MDGVWIPIITVISISVALMVYFYFKAKSKADIQETLRHSLDKGAELTPELIERLSATTSPKVLDLRRGIVLVGLGLACILAGWIGGNLKEGTAIGMFPLMLGIGFLTVWKINKYD